MAIWLNLKDAKEWLKTADERLIGWALEATDPDPYAHQETYTDPLKKLEEFKSVVDLVRKKPTLAEKYPLLYLGAEWFEAEIRSLPIDELLLRLEELESEAFRYEPTTKELVVADVESFLTLKNYLKAIERAAFEDPEFLKQVDRKEIYRLSELVSPGWKSKEEELKLILSKHLGLKNVEGEHWKELMTKEWLRKQPFDLPFLIAATVTLAFRQKDIEQPILNAFNTYATASRLDNYKAKEDFAEVVSTFFDNRADEMFEDLNLVALFGSYILFAELTRVPFTSGDVFSLSKKGNERFVKRPMDWNEIYKRRRITVPLALYPPSDGGLDLENFKKIDYKGVSIYDLVSGSVDTITFSPRLGDNKRDVNGFSNGLFRNVEIAYRERDGTYLPPNGRASTLAHEAIHSLQTLRILSGFLPLSNQYHRFFMERDAYLFESHVLEEYLRLRVRQQKEKPISKYELVEIAARVVVSRLPAYAADWVFCLFDPALDLSRHPIELPLVVERRVLKILNQPPLLREDKKAWREIFGASPVELANGYLEIWLREKEDPLSARQQIDPDFDTSKKYSLIFQ